MATLLEIVTGELSNSNEDIIILLDSQTIKGDAEAKIVHPTMVDSRTIFMSAARYKQVFVSVTGIAFGEATQEEKENGLTKIIERWSGSVKVQGRGTVTYNEEI